MTKRSTSFDNIPIAAVEKNYKIHFWGLAKVEVVSKMTVIVWMKRAGKYDY